jgi:hypothetical protein
MDLMYFFIAQNIQAVNPQFRTSPKTLSFIPEWEDWKSWGISCLTSTLRLLRKKKQLEVSSGHFHALNGFALRGATFRVLPKKYHIKGIVHLAQVRLMVFFKGF